MSDPLSRKQFLQQTLAAAAAFASVGCASDDSGDENADGSDGGGDCSAGATGNITNNHGHTAAVSAADITAAAAKDYDIGGSASHSHTISLSAADMADLAAGMSVTVMSSSDGTHTHDVTLTC